MVREAEQKNKKTLKASSSHLCCVVSLHTTCAGRASQDECVKLFYAHRRCHSCRADYRWWIALHGERWELRWGAAQSDITFCFTWTGAAMQGKNPWLRAITEMQSVIINEHRKVERLENFLSSSALKTLSALKPGEPCWQRGLERKKEEEPIGDSTDSDDYEMFDASLAALTHFSHTTVAGVIKNVRTNVAALPFASLRFFLGLFWISTSCERRCWPIPHSHYQPSNLCQSAALFPEVTPRTE